MFLKYFLFFIIFFGATFSTDFNEEDENYNQDDSLDEDEEEYDEMLDEDNGLWLDAIHAGHDLEDIEIELVQPDEEDIKSIDPTELDLKSKENVNLDFNVNIPSNINIIETWMEGVERIKAEWTHLRSKMSSTVYNDITQQTNPSFFSFFVQWASNQLFDCYKIDDTHTCLQNLLKEIRNYLSSFLKNSISENNDSSITTNIGGFFAYCRGIETRKQCIRSIAYSLFARIRKLNTNGKGLAVISDMVKSLYYCRNYLSLKFCLKTIRHIKKNNVAVHASLELKNLLWRFKKINEHLKETKCKDNTIQCMLAHYTNINKITSFLIHKAPPCIGNDNFMECFMNAYLGSMYT